MWSEKQKASKGMKMALDQGIEFTSRLAQPGWWFVAFRTPEAAHEVRAQLEADDAGFTVEVCPNQSWLRINTIPTLAEPSLEINRKS